MRKVSSLKTLRKTLSLALALLLVFTLLSPAMPVARAAGNKDALQSAYDTQVTKTEATYKSWSWTQFADALAAADTILQDSSAEQPAIDAALAALNLAVTRLYGSTDVLNLSKYDPFKPIDGRLISLGADVTLSNSLDVSLASWHHSHLTSPLIGGVSDTTNGSIANAEVSTIEIDLGKVRKLHSIALFPRQDATATNYGDHFPEEYNIEFSATGAFDDMSGDTITVTGKTSVGADPVVSPATDIEARYIRINMTKFGTNAAGMHIFSGLAVYGMNTAGPKGPLTDLFEEQSDKLEADYKSWSWGQFETALTAAEAVLLDGSADQAAIDTALADLTLASSRLYGSTDVLDLSQYDPFAPAGYSNIGMYKPVTLDNELSAAGWAVANLTSPYIGGPGTEPNGVIANAEDSTIEIDLGKVRELHSILLFPRQDDGAIYVDGGYGKYFPEEYNIEFSKTGAFDDMTADTITETGKIDVGAEPQSSAAALEARYIRINLTKFDTDGSGMHILSGLAIYGVPEAGPKAPLQALVDSHAGKTAGSYKSWSWTQFADARTAAQGVLDNSSATESDIEDAIDALTLAATRLYGRNDILDLTQYDPFRPAGYFNAALGKQVSFSEGASFELSGWFAANLTSPLIGGFGDYPNGWISSVDPCWVVIDLGQERELNSIALFPRQDASAINLDGGYGKYFPVEYNFEFSTDGVTYTDQTFETGKVNVGAEAQFTSTPYTARYVRINFTQRDANNQFYLLSGVAVYGVVPPAIDFDKPQLLLKSGDERTLGYTLTNVDVDNMDLQWSSDNAAVSVNSSGKVTANSEGTAVITLTDTDSGATNSCTVIVNDSPFDAKEHIMISLFWPPQADYVTAEQYDLLADAGINFVQNAYTTDLNYKEINLEMARLAYERDMQVGVYDSRFYGFQTRLLTDAEIRAITNEYKDIPGVGGMYIMDEPYDPAEYAEIYKAIVEEAPGMYPYLNFYPSSSYANETVYRDYMDRFVKAVGADKVEYLMYDRYPFLAAGSLDYTGMFKNMESCWAVGLENDVKTGMFIQSVGIGGAYKRTNENEIRYQIYAALAYGYKQLSYFTWFTPPSVREPFTDAIITADGQKTDLYEPVKNLNAQITALSDTLINLDAKEIYFDGSSIYNMTRVPADFFVHQNGSSNLLYSYMRDKTTGRNYLMVVNNEYTRTLLETLRFDDAITSLEKVSNVDGSLSPVTLTNGAASIAFLPGEGHLFALPADYDYENAAAPTLKTVTFDSNGGSAVAAITDITTGATIAAPAVPTKSGYNFNGWYKESALTNAWSFATDTVTANITLYAKWTVQSVNPPPAPPASPAPLDGLTDVDGKWYEESSQALYKEGILDGLVDEQRRFNPTAPATSAEFVAILARTLNLSLDLDDTDLSRSFTDVPANHPYAKEILALKDAGILLGVGNNRLGLEEMTRARAFTLMYRALVSLGEIEADNSAAMNFKDAASVPSWATTAIANLQRMALVVGDARGNVNPNAVISRAEMAEIGSRIMKLTQAE